MDERILKAFLKIRSELLGLVLVLCACSMVVKNLFLKLPPESSITENLILVGAPLYMAVRSHMMGVTQAGAFSGKRSMSALIAVLAVTAAIFVFAALQGRGEENAGPAEPLLFGAVFLASFCLIRFLYKRHETARQKRLDEKYGE